MGHSSWSSMSYAASNTARVERGESAFAYSDVAMAAAAPADRHVHEDLNPHGVNRESRDSTEHPNSVAIAVLFDVTGSMSRTPRILQEGLGGLMALLTERGYVTDPQILFGAIGDAYSDRGPSQIGQFESGLEMDADLGKLWLEGGGGGSSEESYELAMYFMARHTTIDCLEVRGKKGYLFIIADEIAYRTVDKGLVNRIFGDTIQDNIPLEEIVAELKEKYETYLIFPNEHGASSYVGRATHHAFWKDLFGQNFILLDHSAGISETIAVTIGLNEGTITPEEALAHLREIGTSENIAQAATRNASATVGGVNITGTRAATI